MEDGAGSVTSLEIVLDVEGGEDIVREADGEVGRVGVVRTPLHISRNDVGESFLIVFSEAESGRFGGGRFEVVEIAIFFLVI